MKMTNLSPEKPLLCFFDRDYHFFLYHFFGGKTHDHKKTTGMEGELEKDIKDLIGLLEKRWDMWVSSSSKNKTVETIMETKATIGVGIHLIAEGRIHYFASYAMKKEITVEKIKKCFRPTRSEPSTQNKREKRKALLLWKNILDKMIEEIKKCPQSDKAEPGVEKNEPNVSPIINAK